ncbi:MAG TPA: M23 family metallopeptidase [Steroidobacteraceae bacterium]|nr:M23 family metallopeptidase [Steroidobacteraceae bacterium]
MNIIVFSGRHGGGRSRYFDLAHPLTLVICALVVLGTVGTAFAIGVQLGAHAGGTPTDPKGWSRVLAEQKSEIVEMRARVQDRVDAIARRLGQLDAHIIRIDALGKRLTTMANVDRRQFNFDDEPTAAPALPGAGATSTEIPDISSQLIQLEQRVDLRDVQLSALENVIVGRKISDSVRPAGRPVGEGAISSYFGERSDPFTGEEGFHKGLDFAGTEGEPVVAVAAGIVTWAGERSGYGTLVEINHGNGYITRYAHNESTLVAVGQSVTRGEHIALMGSTGHSTGPHVHFEVLHNGTQIDPLIFVKR